MNKKMTLRLLSIAGFMLIAANLLAAPGNISDLTASTTAPYKVQLTWTAPDPNDGTFAPSGYIVEVSTLEIDSITGVNGYNNTVGFNSIWTSTYNYTLNGGAVTAGSKQIAILSGLYPGIEWFFAVVALDSNTVPGAGNWYGPSDTPQSTLNVYDYAVVYGTNPATVTGLSLGYGNSYINISWQANTEPDIVGYEIDCSSYSSSAGCFSQIAYISTTTVASTGTTYQHNGLINGNTYYYRMRAQNTYAVNSGYGFYSSTQSAMPWISLGAPTFNYAASAAISSTSINWAWNTPLPGGTSGYCVLTSTFGVLYQSTTTTDTGWIQNNLTPNTSSAIFLQVFNGFCTTNSTSSLTHYTWAIPPVNITTTTIASRSMTLSWQNGANSPGTGYTINRSSTSYALSSSVTIVPSSSPITTTTYNDSGLTKGVTYYYFLCGVNNEGICQSYNFASAGFCTIRIPPGVPSFNVSSCSTGTLDGQVNLNWSAPYDDAGDINSGYCASYVVKWSTSNSADYTSSTLPSKAVVASGNSFDVTTVTGLNPGATFYFAVQAVDHEGDYSSYSSTIAIVAQELIPNPPQNVTASALTASSSTISLSWARPTLYANQYDDMYQYAIYRATFSFSAFQANVSSFTVSYPTTYYIDSGLWPQKTTYYYLMTSIIQGSTTGYFSYPLTSAAFSSPITSAYILDTVPPASITQITASPGGQGGEINLAWTCPGDDGWAGYINNGQFRIDYSTTNSLNNFTTSNYQIGITTSVNPYDQNSAAIEGLNAGSTYYFCIWTADPAGNWSSISSTTSAWAQYDVLSPAPITDLTAAPLWRSAALTWTSPGEDGNAGNFTGTYEIRTISSKLGAPIIDTTTWNETGYSSIIISTVSAAPGSLQGIVVPNLVDGTTYFFAVRATHNYAAPSVICSTPTFAAPFDHFPSSFSIISPMDNWIDTATTVNLQWNAASDADTGLGDQLNYTLYYSTDSSFATAPPPLPLGIVNVGSIKTYPINLSAYNDMTVYWYVNAIDSDGNATPSTALAAPTTSYSRVRVYTTATPPESFALSAPANAFDCKTSTPTLTWTVSLDSAPWDVVSYQVDLSTSQNFTAIISSQSIPTTSYITPTLLNDTTYWWRVWASDGLFKTMSNTTGYFRINAVPVTPYAFSLSSPTDSTIFTTTTVNFSWAPTYSPDPDSSVTYSISWSTFSNFSSNVTTVTGLTQTTTSYLNFADHSIYYWYVTAKCSNGLSAQSSQTKFYTDTVQVLPSTFSLIQPGYNVIISTSLTPLFTWGAATVPDPEDEVRYTFYISPNANFSGLGTTAVNTGTDNFYVPVINLTDQTTYYWRVQAAGFIGSPWNTIPVQVDTGTYSATSSFVISMISHPPQNFALTSPANGTVLNTKKPLFKWGQALDSDVNAFVTYTLLVSTSPDFSSLILNVPNITDTQYQVASALAENRTYYWKVTAFSSRPNTHPTSCTANFSFQVPVLTIPQTPMGLQGTLSSDRLKYTISWTPVTKNSNGAGIDDLAGYNIYRGSEQMMVFISSVPAGTNQWTDGSMQGVEYYYRVTAVNNSGIENTLEDSPLLDSLSQGALTYISDDMSLVINVPPQIAQYMLAQNNPYAKDLRIKFVNNPAAETDIILLSYNIDVLTADGVNIDKFNFEQPLTTSFGYGNTTYAGKRLASIRKTMPASSLGELSVYWNNSIEYMRVGGTPSAATQQVAIKVIKTGEYQLRRVSRVSVFSVASVYPPKVFTPNIAPYQTITFYVDNPQGDKVTGKVFNLRGEYVADLAADGDATATSVILSWNGKNSNGAYVTKGVYIYQLEGSGKNINGTIMVAR